MNSCGYFRHLPTPSRHLAVNFHSVLLSVHSIVWASGGGNRGIAVSGPAGSAAGRGPMGCAGTWAGREEWVLAFIDAIGPSASAYGAPLHQICPSVPNRRAGMPLRRTVSESNPGSHTEPQLFCRGASAQGFRHLCFCDFAQLN